LKAGRECIFFTREKPREFEIPNAAALAAVAGHGNSGGIEPSGRGSVPVYERVVELANPLGP